MDPLHALNNVEKKVRKAAQRIARLEHENQTLRKQNSQLAAELAQAQQQLKNIHETLQQLRQKWKHSQGGTSPLLGASSEELDNLWADLNNCIQWSQIPQDKQI